MEGSKGFFFAAGAVTGLAILMARRQRDDYAEFLTSDLVDPEEVASLAKSLNGQSRDDDFILNAWQWVGSNIPYARVGSEMTFEANHVQCERCLLPEMTLEKGSGNCVAKSALLASVLRNRLPPDQVFLVVGDYVSPGDVDGHAWVETYREGDWYLLEATKSPGAQPWVKASTKRDSYIPYVYLNDSMISCSSPSLCIGMSKECALLADCGCGDSI